MSRRYRVKSALKIARGIADEVSCGGDPVLVLTELAYRFSSVGFKVPDVADSDGYLFQYGKVGWCDDPTFSLSMVRQLEVGDSSGDHKYYVQVNFEFQYPLDDELKGMQSRAEWWFPDSGDSLQAWLASVRGAAIAKVMARKVPRDFQVWKDRV